MKKLMIACILLIILLLDACAPVPTASQTENPITSPVPSQTSTALPVTPVESAYAAGNPTAAPLEDILESHSVSFETPDGVVIEGELYGSGKTAVIFSVMGNCKPGWRNFAQLTAAQGIMALTYPWRGCKAPGLVDEDEIKKFVDDLRGAISFVRSRGAEKFILAGASLGGMASARLAAESDASGLIVVASPPEIKEWGFKIDAENLNTDIPKLFITAENDEDVPASRTRELYDLAAEPKEWQTYPGYYHGTDLFETGSGDEMQERILNFILRIAREP